MGGDLITRTGKRQNARWGMVLSIDEGLRGADREARPGGSALDTSGLNFWRSVHWQGCIRGHSDLPILCRLAGIGYGALIRFDCGLRVSTRLTDHCPEVVVKGDLISVTFRVASLRMQVPDGAGHPQQGLAVDVADH